MRDYSQFRSSFWTGETGKALRSDPDAQRLAAYLFTSPHANVIGLYWLPVAYAASETGLSDKGVSEALVRLSGMGFAHYDFATEFVWVVNMAREQLTLAEGEVLSSKDNRGKGARRAAELAKRSSLYPRFVAMYGSALEIAPPATPLQAPSRPPCKPLSTASEEQKGEGEGKGTDHSRPGGLGADAPDAVPVKPPEPDPDAPRRAIAELAQRYRPDVLASARSACALSRRNGKMSDSVWLQTLQAMAKAPVEAVERAMLLFVERYADGQKDERYLLGIVRGELRPTASDQRGTGRGAILRPAPASAFNPTPLSDVFELDEAEGM